MTTAGSDFRNLLGVYLGNSVSILKRVKEAAFFSGTKNYGAALEFNATADETYNISVSGFMIFKGNIELSLSYTD